MVMGSFAEMVRTFPFEEEVGLSLVVREPVGVVAAITPWNYPLLQAVQKVAAALAAGCTVVLKPSELAPLTAFVLADAADEVGLPAGVLNVVTGRGGGGGGPRHPPRRRPGVVHRLVGRRRDGWRPWPPAASSGSCSSWAGSRPTWSSTTPTSTRRYGPASASAS